MLVVSLCLLGLTIVSWFLYRVSMPIVIERISA